MLILLLNFGDCIENAVVLYAYHNWHFIFAGDDAHILWVGDEREVVATNTGVEKTKVAKETACAHNAVGLNSVRVVLNLEDLVLRDVDGVCQ